ncbi:hypothetical protein BaRGS_00000488 [Batillaria attramentaria]|uniref:C-type lectin domain-containing protein n=1 Tax=Batillaria attramentaria TaxID=370345 RepID=A0ABD0M8T1_9CAEN
MRDILLAMSKLNLPFILILVVQGTLGCPNDWIQFEESCYVFLDESGIPWTSAKVMCEALGGSMLEVTSSEENDFVKSHTNENVWLGLNDMVREGQWVWVSTHEQAVYTNWAPGQPDDSHSHESGQDCAYLEGSTGHWDDHWCEITAGWSMSVVCETK